MKPLVAVWVLCGTALFAQTSEWAVFRARLSPANENPPTSVNASGIVDIWAHVVRDASGQITSGSVDFDARYQFASAVNITGFHIHSGNAGDNGPVTIDSGLSAGNGIPNTTSGRIQRSAVVLDDARGGLSTLRGMFTNPAGYYANIHTSDNPGGAIRAQLERADVTVLMGMMSFANEVPPADSGATGIAQVLVLTTRNAAGAMTSAEVIEGMSFNFPSTLNVTGFHIHNAPAGQNGGIVLPAVVPTGFTTDPAVNFIRVPLEIDMSNVQQTTAVNGLLTNPGDYYLNMHTTQNPGGALRAQLHRTDKMVLQANMLPANENPPTTVQGSAIADVTVYTLRNEDGSVQAGTVIYDVNYRFPANTQFTGLHIHQGAAGGNGPVTLPAIPSIPGGTGFTSDTGSGNYFLILVPFASGPALDTLNTLVAAPENAYINMHTTTNPGGAVRAQLGPATSGTPTITAITNLNFDKSQTTFAPGSLVAIFGTNLAKVATDLSGWTGTALPEGLNGVAVGLGVPRARLLYVSPTQLNVQLPFELTPGQQAIAVSNGSATSKAFNINIANAAPMIFTSAGSAIAVKNSDQSFIGTNNPARAGDLILVYATGLGQTNPPLQTGQLTPPQQINTAPVTATVGGQTAQVLSSVAYPGYAGLYQIALTVPSGLTGSTANVVLSSGGAQSNAASIAVR